MHLEVWVVESGIGYMLLFKPRGMKNIFLPSFEKIANHPNSEERKVSPRSFLVFAGGGTIFITEHQYKGRGGCVVHYIHKMRCIIIII